MKLTPVVAENLKKITIYNLGLTIIENAVFFIIGFWGFDVLAGSLFGYAVSVINFLWLGLSVQKAMEKEQKQAQLYMQSTYTARMVLFAASFAIALIVPVFNWIAAVIPFIFTRISIMIINFTNKEGIK